MADESTDRVARGFPRALPASDTWCGSSNETGPHRAAPRRPGPAKSPENDPHGGTSALLAVQLPSKPEPRTAARPQAGEKDGGCAADTTWLAGPPTLGRLGSPPPTGRGD